ncbi:golgin subfamily A member 6-like protein 2 [Stomoxys calcitrans]|uniref:Uncharacterized protein n=1 Tax=Stomoxys calcitrans TaxID=35570 RepID=A0A1I8PZ43_STOCA|nr:golgin subfamily A member 6-like protein 2 [Stomoxys calcitrans]
MLTKEDVEGWNKVFADCQIKQSDLTQPSEGFLVKALVCYTRRFGYKVEPPFPLNGEKVENNKENRLFLIRLARQVDHFLKITDKSYSFTYYELIRPTPKKTSHSLYILLNYLFYYNMYKEEVFKMAHEPIQKFHEIKALIIGQQQENEKRMQDAKVLKMNVDELLKKVPHLRSEHKELSKRNADQEEEKKKLKGQFNELAEKLKHLTEQKRSLLKRVVADEEQQELQKQIESLQADLTQRKELAATNEATLRKLTESVKLMQHLKKEVEKAHDIVPLRLVEQLAETKKQLDRAMEEEDSAHVRQKQLSQIIEEEQQNYDALEQQHQAKKQEFEQKEKTCKAKIESLQRVLKEKDDKMAHIEKQDQALECELKEQQEIAEFLEKNIAIILDHYDGNST